MTHLLAFNNRIFCGNRRAQNATNAIEFRLLLANPVAPVSSHGGMIGERVCAKCAEKLAAADARKAKPPTFIIIPKT